MQISLPPDVFHAAPCGTNCLICTKSWQKTFQRVHREEVVKLFEYETFQRALHSIEVKGDNIIDTLWKVNGPVRWRVDTIYGIKSVDRFHFDALFLQLLGKKMIDLSQTSRGLAWSFRRSPNPHNDCKRVLKYKLGSSWMRIYTFYSMCYSTP
jgi:hypothetical protein